MHSNRKQLFLDDLYAFCFNWLDNEIELTSDDVGAISSLIKYGASKTIDYIIETDKEDN